MDSFSKFTQNVSTNWSPFAEKLASEKLTSNAEVTELPTDYVALEQRYEAVRHATQSLVRLTRSYTAPPNNFDVQALQQ
ncbi:hypothetical protein H4S02_011234, partial [Coemansia sp. RSA 2611]